VHAAGRDSSSASAVLSFANARPRGYSEKEYDTEDDFEVVQPIEHLRYERGTLRFDSEYVRGRCMKTDITVRPNGCVTLSTRCRGEAALRWLDRLKVKKLLAAVEPAPPN
jgi:hypothetical protein